MREISDIFLTCKSRLFFVKENIDSSNQINKNIADNIFYPVIYILIWFVNRV